MKDNIESVKELLASRGYFKNDVIDENALMAAASKEAMEFYTVLKDSKKITYDFFKLTDQLQDLQSKGLYDLFSDWIQRICDDIAHTELDELYLAALDAKVLEMYSCYFCMALKLITELYCAEIKRMINTKEAIANG